MDINARFVLLCVCERKIECGVPFDVFLKASVGDTSAVPSTEDTAGGDYTLSGRSRRNARHGLFGLLLRLQTLRM